MTEKILVFGAGGRVGAQVIKALPPDLRIAAADREWLNPAVPPNVEPVTFDFNRPLAEVDALFTGVKRMFLLWPPGVNVTRGMAPVITAAAEAGVEQVVFLSILGADKLRIVPHRAVERLLEKSKMDWVFIRSGYFMQNLSGIHAQEIRDRGEIFLPAGSGSIGMIDVRDVAAVAAKALLEGHRNQAYALTGSEAVTFSEAAQRLVAVLDRPVIYRNPSVRRFWKRMRQRGLPAGLIIFMIIEYTAAKMGKSGQVTGEVARLLDRPPITLEQFAGDYRAAWDVPRGEITRMR